MSDVLANLLTFSLPAGFLGSVVQWVFSKKKRDNDFISDLQKSIDLLSERYNATLKELIEVKEQNAELLASQKTLTIQVKALTKENDLLRKTVEELNERFTNIKTITRTK